MLASATWGYRACLERSREDEAGCLVSPHGHHMTWDTNCCDVKALSCVLGASGVISAWTLCRMQEQVWTRASVVDQPVSCFQFRTSKGLAMRKGSP